MHGQINVIKFGESNKLIMHTAKFETLLFDQFFKIGCALIHQIIGVINVANCISDRVFVHT